MLCPLHPHGLPISPAIFFFTLNHPKISLFPMGFYYRKSVKVGPFRINLSNSGVGYSVGGRGFRTGVSSRGRRYSSFSLPGTGVGYRTSGSRGNGCLFLVGGLVAGAGLLLKSAL